MARNSICTACERGDHTHHRYTIHGVSEGMIGGVVCACKGECKDGRYRKTFKDLMGYPRRG